MNHDKTGRENEPPQGEQREERALITQRGYSPEYMNGGTFFRAATLRKLGTKSEPTIFSVLRRLNVSPGQEKSVFFRPYCDALKVSTSTTRKGEEKRITSHPRDLREEEEEENEERNPLNEGHIDYSTNEVQDEDDGNDENFDGWDKDIDGWGETNDADPEKTEEDEHLDDDEKDDRTYQIERKENTEIEKAEEERNKDNKRKSNTEGQETKAHKRAHDEDDTASKSKEPPAKINKADDYKLISGSEPSTKSIGEENADSNACSKGSAERGEGVLGKQEPKKAEGHAAIVRIPEKEKEKEKEIPRKAPPPKQEKPGKPIDSKDLEKVIKEAQARAKQVEKELTSPPVFRSRKMEKSALSQGEHKLIYGLLKERKPLSPQILGKVKLEKERYRSHFFKEAWENKVCFYWLSPVALEIFEHYSEGKKKYAQLFPRLYKKVSRVNMRDIQMPCLKPRFNHMGKIFECGSCPEFVKRKTPYELLHFKAPQKEHAPLLQEDKIVESWTRRSPCNVVITASALTTMFNLWGHPYVTHEWTVPCFVKSGPNGAKTLYINKPFLKERMTPREKNARVFKALFESSGVNTRGERARMELHHSALEPDFEAGSQPYCGNDNRGLLYELWKLDEITLLVRSRANACQKGPGGEGKDGLNFAAVFAKLHYCTVNKRREVYCQGESASWWMRTALHPKERSKAIIAHVNPLSGTVLDITELSLSQIPEKAPFMGEYAFNFLKYVFTTMRERDDGSYVLQCWMSGPRSVQTFTVFEETRTGRVDGEARDEGLEEGEIKDDEIFDLHEKQRVAGATATDEIPYMPPIWVPKQNRIPETLPFEREKPQKRETEKHGERFCYEFALKGKCSNPGCRFPHKLVSDEEKKQLVLRKEELFQEKEREKKRERNKRKQKNKRVRERAKKHASGGIPAEKEKGTGTGTGNPDNKNDDDKGAGKEEEEEEENFFDSCSSSDNDNEKEEA